MKLYLHIGMAKTGTTALQNALFSNRKVLAKHGVLYPKFGKLINHNLLSIKLGHGDRAARLLRNKYKGKWDDAEAKLASYWGKLYAEVEKSAPNAIILSGEYFFSRLNDDNGPEFKAFIEGLTDDIEIICYVRQPSKMYLSLAQQNLKLAGQIKEAGPTRFRSRIEAWSRIFDGNLHVIKYERDTLVGNDITSDFLSRVAPGIKLDLTSGRDKNESLSAESMAIMQEFQKTSSRN